MNDDDIIQALHEVEREVADIEAELTSAPSPTVAQTQSAAVFQPPSLASLSLQCKSISLIDVVNVGLNFRHLPAAWAQNEALCGMVPPHAYNVPLQPNSSLQHGVIIQPAAAAVAPARVFPRSVSSSWKRCLFAAAGITRPLADMWLDAFAASDSSADRTMVPVRSALLRFLPLIDPQFADCATRDFEVNFCQSDLQVPSAALLHHSPVKPSLTDDLCDHVVRSEQQCFVCVAPASGSRRRLESAALSGVWRYHWPRARAVAGRNFRCTKQTSSQLQETRAT
jgi:hypothetical protein